jgi:hypothetical protein
MQASAGEEGEAGFGSSGGEKEVGEAARWPTGDGVGDGLVAASGIR